MSTRDLHFFFIIFTFLLSFLPPPMRILPILELVPSMQLAELGVKCDVIAPTLVPMKSGDRVKTDRRDAERLARSFRSGDLTAVWVPDAGSEALRDLVRAREAAKQDQLRARHRLSKFLLRSGQRPAAGLKAWTQRGSITKTGNAHLRRIVVEAAWSYRLRPGVGPALRKRQEGLPEEIKEIAWKAQQRLHKRYCRLAAAGKEQRKIIPAVGRKLLGFWAIGIKAEAASKLRMAA